MEIFKGKERNQCLNQYFKRTNSPQQCMNGKTKMQFKSKQEAEWLEDFRLCFIPQEKTFYRLKIKYTY